MPDKSVRTATGSRSEWAVHYIFDAGRRLYVACWYGPHVPAVILKPPTIAMVCEYKTGAATSFGCR